MIVRLEKQAVCPLCQSDSQTLFEKNDIPILECQECRHRFCSCDENVEEHVADEFNDDYFFGGESCYDDYSEMAKDLNHKGARYAQILERNFKNPLKPETAPRILDIGCAAGYLLEGFENQGWQGTGIEANLSMANTGRRMGLDVHHSTIESFRASESFHAASLVQVLPHLMRPDESLRFIHDMLLPDGLMLIETWSCRSMTARMMGKLWHQYNPPSVLHWFSRRSLRNLLEQNGFEVVQQGRPIKWINLGNGFAALKRSVDDSKLLSTLVSPTQLIPSWVKVPYFMDDVFWMVARKKTVKIPRVVPKPNQIFPATIANEQNAMSNEMAVK